MIKDKFVLILLLLSFMTAFQAVAQNEEPDSVKQETYFTDLSHLLNVRLYLLAKSNSLSIKYEGNKLVYKPNSPVSLGFGVNYKGWGIALGFGLPHSKEKIEKYGSTKRFDMQMSLYTSLISGHFYFQSYRGYYLTNPDDFTDWTEEKYPQVPELRTVSLGASAYYLFNNKKYSAKADMSRTQMQNKSAGSFLLGLFFNYDEADSPEGFIPKDFADSVSAELDINYFRYYAVGVMFGYSYHWVISKKFFLHAALIPGFGYKSVQMKFTSGDMGSEHAPHAQVMLKGAFGVELKRVYLGASIFSLVRSMKYKDFDIDLATESIRIYIGKRFNLSP